eukprot:6539479-Lingulodinium_polyedra.AAC.1
MLKASPSWPSTLSSVAQAWRITSSTMFLTCTTGQACRIALSRRSSRTLAHEVAQLHPATM